MIRALLIAALLAAAADKPDDAKTRALVEGQMPDDPAKPLVQAKCMMCHSGEYLTQQRLSEGAWQKEVDKMRKFGTPASEDEGKAIAAYLARNWTPDLPASRPVRAKLPRGSVPGK